MFEEGSFGTDVCRTLQGHSWSRRQRPRLRRPENHDYTTGGSPWDTVGTPGRAEIFSKGAGTHVLSDGLSQTSVGCDQGAQERIRAAESHGVEVADDLPVGGDDCRFGVGDALGRAVFLDQGA